MCIITSTVDSISKTKIYVSADETNRRQITIYSNEVGTQVENAMILPVPHPTTVKFLNFNHYKDVFGDLRSCFSNRYLYSRASLSHTRGVDTLPVYSVGSYNASIVETLNDFERLDTVTFDLAYGLLEFLERKYRSTGFGFIVCQLKPANRTYHPFAYTHHQHPNGRLFVPTMHYHVHPYSGGHINEEVGDWDHKIYSPATTLRTDHEGELEYKYDMVKWDRFPPEYRWAKNVEMTLWERTGDWKNCDLFATHTTDPRKWSA